MNIIQTHIKAGTALLLPFLLCVLLLSGCSGSLKDVFNFTSIDEDGNVVEKENPELPAKELLLKGMDDYRVGKYYTAIESFEEILNKFPFSEEAILAELKAADCSYYLDRYAEALLLYEEFENRHPTNESIPYVMFQKAMCNYKQIDRIDRDTSGAAKSIELFKQLLKAYPESPYTAEAQTKLTEATEFLANHEYFVVEYYVRTEKYDQAKVRLNYMLAVYPDTTIAPKAKELLARLETGDYPRSPWTSWLPRVDTSNWPLFGKDATATDLGTE